MNIGTLAIIFCIFALCGSSMAQSRRENLASQKKLYDVCGDPKLACTARGFPDEALPIKINGQTEHFGEYKSKPFYAVIVQSRRVVRRSHPAENDYYCGGQFTASERSELQSLFPNNRVFSSEFGCYTFYHLYTNVNQDFNFLAVYGGASQREASKVLKAVKASGRYAGANIRRMQAVLCQGCH